MNKVAELLKKQGPMLSGDLARLYERTYGVSNEAARKAISRATSPVKKLYKIKFDKNQIFYYLDSQFMGSQYVDSLLQAVETHSKVVYTYIQAFISQSGVVSKELLPSFVSAPIGKVKGHRQHEDVLAKLIDAQIIRDSGEDTYSISPMFHEAINAKRSRGLEIAKNVITRDFNSWARGVNLVAFEQGKCLFENPCFGQFQWAYTAPSYIQPLYSYESKKPGFVVADVFFGKTATPDSIKFFLQKIKVLRSYKNIQPFLPVLLVDKVDHEALQLLKESKVMVALLNNMFSDKYTELLNDLVNVFANATAILANDPGQIHDLFEAVEKSEGRYNNLAGDLFELLVGSYYARVGCQYLKSQEEVIDYETGKKKEIDLLVVKDGKCIIVECKAQKAKLSGEYVRKWLNENIPVIRKCLLAREHYSKMEFQLWSVSGFDDEALTLLKKTEKNTKYSVLYYDKEQMISVAKDKGDQYFVDIMKKHFIIK